MNEDKGAADICTRVGNLEAITSNLGTRVGSLEAVAQKLREDVAEIKGLMPNIATKADLAVVSERLSTKIDSAVIGLINQALSTYPARAGALWTAVGAIAMIIAVVITVLQATHHL